MIKADPLCLTLLIGKSPLVRALSHHERLNAPVLGSDTQSDHDVETVCTQSPPSHTQFAPEIFACKLALSNLCTCTCTVWPT